MISLNYLLKQIKTVAEAHAQVNTYAQGQRYDFSASEALLYPCVWAIPNGASLDLQGRQLGYNITLVIMDIERADGSNQIDILNDTILILTDLVAKIQENNEDASEWVIGSVGNLTPFVDSFLDTVSGHSIDLTINAFFGEDICNGIIS